MSDQKPESTRTEVTIRRAPKFSAFIMLGGAVGLLATLILTSMFPVDPKIGFGATFGFFALYGVPVGMMLGAVVAIILDRRSTRHAITASAEHTHRHDSAD